MYMNYYARFVRPEGRIGIVVPGLYHDLDKAPRNLTAIRSNDGHSFWDSGFW